MPQHSTNQLPLGPANPPDIKVIFRGFLVTIIKHGAATATIGALDGVAGDACHKPITHVYQIDRNTEATTEIRDVNIGVNVDEIHLTVDGQPGIEVFQKDEYPFYPFDIDNDVKDFRWFVDLNKIHNRDGSDSIAINMSKLKPKFVLNAGVFHVSKLSDSEGWISRYQSPPKRFGRFAMEITARIVLHGARAVLDYGSTPFPMGGPGDPDHRYEIVFDCTCRSRNETDSDFDTIYHVITEQNGSDLDCTEQVVFGSATTLAPAEGSDPLAPTGSPVPAGRFRTPEVYCSGGNCTSC